jgi:hypothetical protein
VPFNTSAAQVQVAGDNLILIFNDGGRIVFENLAALAPSENATVFAIAGSEVPGGALFREALALAEGEVRLEAAVTIETVAGAVRTPGRVGQSSDDAGDGQDVMDLNDILIGPEGPITVLSGSKLNLDTSDNAGGEPGTHGTVAQVGLDNSAGGEFLPESLVTVPDITLDYPTGHSSWSSGPLTDAGLKSDPHP